MRTFVYVDGFNFYYGCLKGTDLKWLDLGAFLDALLPRNEVVRIKYFTARIKGKPSDPGQLERQEVYLRALRSDPRVRIYFGIFLEHVKSRPLADGGGWARVRLREEKRSDVNLAVQAVKDGFRGDYDAAILVTNDSDQVETVRVIRRECHKAVGVVNPVIGSHQNRELARAAGFRRTVRRSTLRRCQFPDLVQTPSGPVSRPRTWAP